MAAESRDGDLGIRTRVRQVTERQRLFEQSLSRSLSVDAPGLSAMTHLLAAGPLTPTELARRLGISTAATTLVLNRLEAAGHVRRDRHPSDGRKLIVTATDRSAARAQARVAPLIAGVEELVASLDPAESAAVLSFLDRLLAVYDEATEEPRA
ncbi:MULTISPECIES: MarR family transcriptional regulator [unclassified Rathayibacter]|jgi:DNA-binding MarR family transcriptional regulator|uniref:MarR family winged helix-turn-helix transcriptional regulator n=1 Tax=unclassified Rathayibacter TaxID=2609250 RepID=UPI00131F7CC0|nr:MULTISPECIES: MarR family transcriptional regulator [unclassified Rathayibacter]QHC71605.1 MarR family transcriptional regulator [Rathayibacter sp. VKM Ac-2801]QHC74934.1 MarR family transcriptional regulator [Rathayibacter sp. VKM Ac-2805]